MSEKRIAIWGLILLGGLMISACFWGIDRSVVENKINRAELVVRQAMDNHAETHAPLELKKAQEMLDEARAQMEEKEYEAALMRAEQAIAEGELADQKAKALEAEQNLKEKEETLDILRQELNR